MTPAKDGMEKYGKRLAGQKGWDALYRTDLIPVSLDWLLSYINICKNPKWFLMPADVRRQMVSEVTGPLEGH